MSDPHNPTGIGKPQRADPLQPDRPGSGNSKPDPKSDPAPAGGTTEADDKRKSQSDDALKNVGEGYD